MITALDVINDDEHLPTTHIKHDRKWRKSQVSPMGGRIILELLSCESHEGTGEQDRDSKERGLSKKKYVRLNINDGITALPDCHTGPGRSCPLEDFIARTERKGEETGRFGELCGLEGGREERITFLHQ